ncbi:hypothetical protein C8F04DRAFT_1098881 [Mycena alexandri]|uniref:Ubiquitin-like protease family profile domain-containing protein n=1 Tax=Mycena alexandri TaxID=1745969 RepID=A0AAD6SWH5_9AGAR|nr:hypothetical protein C8F04DRAFT_1098881 [Mycena alexandri]
MRTVAAYFNGDDLVNVSDDQHYTVHCLNIQEDGASCGFWASALCLLLISGVNITSENTLLCLRMLKASGVKDHLKEIWTSWRIAEDGLEEVALNRFLKPFKTQRSALMNSCIASRPPWISRAEEVVQKPVVKSEKSGPIQKDQHPLQDDVFDEHAQTLAQLKTMADDFSLRLSGKRHKLVGLAGPLFLNHLYRISSLDGWFSVDIINEWAQHLNDNITLSDTKVHSVHFFNSLRSNSERLAKDKKRLNRWWERILKATRKWFKVDDTRMAILPIHVPSHWICAFVDFDYKYLAIFDSWEREPVPNDDWKESNHAHIFCLLMEWLQRLFLSLESAIDWTEWRLDPCPVNQPYQVNSVDCGPHTCFLMSCLVARQTTDIRKLNTIITPESVQKFRYIVFGHIMKLPTLPIEPGDNEEIVNDSDWEIISPMVSEDESEIEVSSPRPIIPPQAERPSSPLTSIPPSSQVEEEIVLPRRSGRKK